MPVVRARGFQRPQRRLQLEPLESRSLLAVVSLTPIADNTIFQDSPQNSNGAGQYLFAGQAFSAAGIRRALLLFDVASAIPAGSQINSATLELRVSKIQPSVPGPHAYGVHRVLASWGEGTSDASGEEGTGTAASSGDATWSHRFFNQTQWSTAGGQFAPTPSDTTSIGGVGSYQWSGSLAADVQLWLDTPSTQFGWMIKEVNETIEGSAKRFDSRQSPTPNFRPKLTIDFSAPNQPPTLDPVADPPAINEDAPQQTINLTGISAGPGETQQLLVTATSSAPELIPDPFVNYVSPNATGFLQFTPAADRSGTATITVIVRDAGSDNILGNGDDLTVSRTFTVAINPVNDPPTLDAINSPPAINEDALQQTINLTGITAGPNELQALSVTATASDTNLIPSLSVVYTSPQATGSLRYTPAANRSGIATITVTVRDAGLDNILGNGDDAVASRTFSVTVNPVNDPPTIQPISDPPAIEENAAEQSIPLTGISAGPLESQTLSVTATSNNPQLIQPIVEYTSPAATGAIRYTPAANQTGSATITVTVRDAGLNNILNDGDDATVSTQFTVVVNPAGFVNQPPSFTKGPDRSATDEDGLLTFQNWATAMSPGPAGEEQQTLTFLVENDANSLFEVQPQISPTGTLTFDPAPNVRGTAVVTVRLKDSGGTAGGGNDTSPPQTFNISISKPHVWHNARLPLDITGDGNIVAGDALSIINYINAFRAGPLPGGAAVGPDFLDPSADNFVAPNDALEVINFINANGPFVPGGSGEGEAHVTSRTDPTRASNQVPHDLLSLLAADIAAPPRRRTI